VEAALAALKKSLVQGFLSEQPQWRARLQTRALRGLGSEDRAALSAELLPQLVRRAHGRPDEWEKLERFSDHVARGSAARWRMDVRKAAIHRMRTILVDIAGRVLLVRHDERRRPEDAWKAQRRALKRLERCEAFAAGKPPAAAAARSVGRNPVLSIAQRGSRAVGGSLAVVAGRELPADAAVCSSHRTAARRRRPAGKRSTRALQRKKVDSRPVTSFSARPGSRSTRRASCRNGP